MMASGIFTHPVKKSHNARLRRRKFAGVLRKFFFAKRTNTKLFDKMIATENGTSSGIASLKGL